jgi:hypothetical protein
VTDPRPESGSSRKRYKQFVEDYKQHRLDELIDAQNAALARAGMGPEPAPAKTESESGSETGVESKGRKKPRLSKKRREYIRLYLRWLKPQRGMLVGVIIFAILLAVL